MVIKKSAEKEMQGIENKLNFKSPTIDTSTVPNQTLSAFCRISNYLDSGKCNFLVNAFVKSQFSYCPLIWMFCTHEFNYRLNRVNDSS